MSSDNSQDTTFTDLLKNAFRSQIMDIHTAIPAKVLEYSASEGKVSVEVGVKRRYLGEDSKPYPVIPEVPVRFQRSAGGEALIKLPIKKGDTGLLVFSERSLEKWLIAKDTVDPQDPRIFDISDATFAPDLVQDHLAGVNDDDSLDVGYGKMGIKIWPSGKIEIKGDSEEFVGLFIELINEMIGAKVITSLGPQPFTVDTIAKLTALKLRAETIKK